MTAIAIVAAVITMIAPITMNWIIAVAIITRAIITIPISRIIARAIIGIPSVIVAVMAVVIDTPQYQS